MKILFLAENTSIKFLQIRQFSCIKLIATIRLEKANKLINYGTHTLTYFIVQIFKRAQS